MNNILNDREKRYQENVNLSKENYVLVVKSNVKGEVKNTGYAYYLVKYFTNILEEKFKNNILSKDYFESFDGPFSRIILKKEIKNLKEVTIEIEDNNILGRLIDIDVFYEKEIVSRNKKRTCLICDNSTFDCIKSNAHSQEEFDQEVFKILSNHFKLEKLIDDAIEDELHLHPKLGSVSYQDKGSHYDMDYKIMMIAKEAILDYFLEMFKIGYENEFEFIFDKIKVVGIQAENQMHRKTKGVNCYKGLIFCLGIIISSFGYLLKNKTNSYKLYQNLFETVKKIVYNKLEEPLDTYGYYYYWKFNFGGVRKEAKEGFTTLAHILEFSKTNQDKLAIFQEIVLKCDDSVLLKRAKTFELYDLSKKLLKERGIINMNEFFVKNKLSCGGSCDLFVCFLFLKYLNLEGDFYA